MAITNNLRLTLVAQSQAQKEVTINEAFYVLEALQNRGVKDKDLAIPPISSAEGDAYIVAAGASGVWAAHDSELAYFNQIWKFIIPNEGLLLWVEDEDKIYVFDGSAWVSVTDNLNNLKLLGVNAAADISNKFTVASEAVLFNHNGADIRTKLNKNSAGDTASFIFQDGYSGRAEFGLIGNDDFTLKVSSDGSSWNNSLVVDKSSGKIAFGGGTQIAKILSATATLDFPGIAANSSVDLTIAVNGAVPGASVELGLPPILPAGVIFTGFVSAADIVTIRAFNVTGAALDPASASYRATVTTY